MAAAGLYVRPSNDGAQRAWLCAPLLQALAHADAARLPRLRRSWARVWRLPPLKRRCCPWLLPEWSACRRPRLTTQRAARTWDRGAHGGEPRRGGSASPLPRPRRQRARGAATHAAQRCAGCLAARSRWLQTPTPIAFAVRSHNAPRAHSGRAASLFSPHAAPQSASASCTSAPRWCSSTARPVASARRVCRGRAPLTWPRTAAVAARRPFIRSEPTLPHTEVQRFPAAH